MHRYHQRGYNDWRCPLCNVAIYARKDACTQCKTPRVKPGDWVCRRGAPCTAEFNFASRATCRACAQPKPAACLCSAPQFQSIYVNGNHAPLGPCVRCLLPNPTPWYRPVLDAEEEKARAAGLPQEHVRYRICATGRYPTHNSLGLGEQVPMHANRWLFRTRQDVEAELKAHATLPYLKVGDARKPDWEW